MAMTRVLFVDVTGKTVRGYATNDHEMVLVFTDDTFVALSPEWFVSGVTDVDNQAFDAERFPTSVLEGLGWVDGA